MSGESPALASEPDRLVRLLIGSEQHRVFASLNPVLLKGLPPEQLLGVTRAFDAAFMDGFRVSLIVGSCVLLLAAIVANRFIPGGAPVHEVRRTPAEVQPVVAEI